MHASVIGTPGRNVYLAGVCPLHLSHVVVVAVVGVAVSLLVVKQLKCLRLMKENESK